MKSTSSEQQLLIFLHIPKAAGTTFKHVLRKQYGQHAIASLPVRESQDSLKHFTHNSPIFEEEHIKVISGHTIYGVHQYLKRQSTYFSFVREPISRVISDYYYLLRNKAYPNHDYVIENELTLKEYVLSGKSKLVDNFQTRVLSGLGESVAFDQCSQEMLEQAKKNISNQFVLLGIVERFDETLLLLRYLLDWQSNLFYPYPLYFKQNQTKNRPPYDEIDVPTREAIRNQNLLDIELYQFAINRFDSHIKSIGFPDKNEIDRYKSLNNLYSMILNLYVDQRSRFNHLIGRKTW